MSILENSFLRKLAGPLRQASPRLYRALAGVRGQLITMTSGTSGLGAYQALAVRRFRDLCLGPDPAKLDVLEVGTDVRMAVLDVIAGFGVRSVVGVNPSAAMWEARATSEVRSPRGGRLLRGDATRLEFADQTFDRVFSIAVFEHILDIPAALAELFRVLRPGGMVYANFGPIWSGGKGHHVNASVGGRRIHHTDVGEKAVPDFAHLLLTPEQMRTAITRSHDPEMANTVVDWIWRSTEINRMFFHEYVEAFEGSPFRIVSLVPAVDPVSSDLTRVLRLRFPEESRFDVTNAEVLLLKA